MPTVLLSIPPQTEQVRTARLVAGAAARRCGVDDEILEEVRLAVGEACARAVVRHQTSGTADDIELELNDEDAMFTVRVLDRGGVEEADDEGALALAVIAALVPDSNVESGSAGSVINMTWPLLTAQIR